MRTIAPLVFVLFLASGCVHREAVGEPDDGYDSSRDSARSAGTVRDVDVTYDGPGDREGEGKIIAFDVPASPHDRPPPEPVFFRLGAGLGAMGHIDLAPCRTQGLPPGYLHMRVTFKASGRVTHAAIQAPTAPPGEALECISHQLEVAVVPHFDGGDVTLSRNVFVTPPDALVTVQR